MEPQSWRCPYCGSFVVLREGDEKYVEGPVGLRGPHGNLYGAIWFTVCANPDCNKLTVVAGYGRWNAATKSVEEVLRRVQLEPPSAAKPFPDYIPAPIREDYEEACLIKDLSPKAAATLCRRCLQGMIRDRWGIVRKKLFDEIEDLPAEVSSDARKQLHAVRAFGNIGAHMQQDVDVVVAVEQGEVGLLVDLIETLMQEWYVERHEREERAKKLLALAEEKTKVKGG